MSGPNKVYATREEARLASQHQWAMGELVRLEAENQRLKDEAKDTVLAAAFYEMRGLRDAAVAEIQQLREKAQRLLVVLDTYNEGNFAEADDLRDALAGDAG